MPVRSKDVNVDLRLFKTRTKQPTLQSLSGLKKCNKRERMVPPPAPPVAPPPPPPPPVSKDGSPMEDAAGALFAEISALGENGVRSSLKKATKGPVNDSGPREATTPKEKSKGKNVNLGGEPKCSLSGKKWAIEFQNGANGDNAVSIDTDLKQTAYIYKCHDSLIKVNGKVNAIVLDCCTKTACIFEEALASVEIVNSKDVQIQCLKTAPAVSIDGCTSVTYYMSPGFADAQIITAKSAAINLVRPTDDDGMFPCCGHCFFVIHYLFFYQLSWNLTLPFLFLFYGLFDHLDIVETPIPEQFW